MPLVADAALKLAAKNVASYGDTDIFPFPTENHIFFDKPKEICSVLREIDKDFEGSLVKMPVLTSKELAELDTAALGRGRRLIPSGMRIF